MEGEGWCYCLNKALKFNEIPNVSKRWCKESCHVLKRVMILGSLKNRCCVGLFVFDHEDVSSWKSWW